VVEWDFMGKPIGKWWLNGISWMKKASGYVKKATWNMAIESSWIFPMNSMVI